MPTFAVHIKVAGPFRDLADGKRFAGAYSHRYVIATDAMTAEKRAIESLQKEQQFTQLRPVEGIGSPPMEVDEVRQVPWYEGFFSDKALVLYRKPPDQQT